MNIDYTEIYHSLLEAIAPIYPRQAMLTAERGCLALAAWGVETVADAAALRYGTRSSVESGDRSRICLRVLIWAYRGYARAHTEVPDFIKNIYRTLFNEANKGKITTFVLTSKFDDYPDFFRLEELALIQANDERE